MMPQIKFSHVVSFSTEDSSYPASNLLSGDIVNKRWMCHKGESTPESVVLQLERSTQISQVHIGNHQSAFVEVLVGRSEAASQDFQVLICANSFMSPSDSRNSENINRVKTFSGDQLASDVKDKKWDRIRVVCTQPYKKHVQFGLSFIQIFSSEKPSTVTPKIAEPSTQTTQLGRFRLRKSSSEDENEGGSFKPGELFARQKQGTLSIDAEIRKAGRPDLIESKEKASSLLVKAARPTKDKTHVNKPKDGDDSEKTLSRKRSELMFVEDDDKEHDKIDRVMKRDREQKVKEKSKEVVESPSRNKIKDSTSHEKTNKTDSRNQSHEKTNKTDSRNQSQEKTNKIDSQEKTNKTDSRNQSQEKTNKIDSQEKTNKTDSRNQSQEKTNKIDSQEKTNKTDSPKVQKHKDRTPKQDKEDKTVKDDGEKKGTKRYSSDDNDDVPSAKKLRDSKQDEELKNIPRGAHCLRGVVFVLSGYVNPQRSNLRDTAISLGGRYASDWAPNCTHLVCAFPNTPKHDHVKKRSPDAAVVNAKWIEDCDKEQAHLPWKWYALDPQQKVSRPDGPLSKPQEKKPDFRNTKQDRPSTSKNSKRKVSVSEDDTDDEIEKAMNRQKETESQKKQDVKTNVSVSDSDTDVDEEMVAKINANEKQNAQKTPDKNDSYSIDTPLKKSKKDDTYSTETQEFQKPNKDSTIDSGVEESLPDLFQFLKFYVDPNLENTKYDVREIKRYIIAYGGDIYDNWPDKKVDVVITHEDFVSGLRFDGDKRCMYLRPEWIWKCNDTETLYAFEDYNVI